MSTKRRRFVSLRCPVHQVLWKLRPHSSVQIANGVSLTQHADFTKVFFTFKCRAVSRHTRACIVTNSHKKNVPYRALIFTNITNGEQHYVQILGEFSFNCEKRFVSFVKSVRPPVHMEQLGSHWPDFLVI